MQVTSKQRHGSGVIAVWIASLLISAFVGVTIGIGRLEASSDSAAVQFDTSLGSTIGTNADTIAGPLPRDVIESVGSVDYSRIPKYIEVLDRLGEFAGYVESIHVFDPTSNDSLTPPVFAEDLRTIVGHFHFGGIGFVALGTDASNITPVEGSEVGGF